MYIYVHYIMLACINICFNSCMNMFHQFHMGVSKNSGFSLQIIHFLVFSIILTIHFGENTTILGNTHISSLKVTPSTNPNGNPPALQPDQAQKLPKPTAPKAPKKRSRDTGLPGASKRRCKVPGMAVKGRVMGCCGH